MGKIAEFLKTVKPQYEGDYKSTPEEIKSKIADNQKKITDLKSKLSDADADGKKKIQGHISSLEDTIKFYKERLKPKNEEGGDSMANNGQMPTDGASKTKGFIKELIDTSWSGSNEEQMKAVELLKGLATSDEPEANDFMKKLDDFTSGMKEEPQESFVESYLDGLIGEVAMPTGVERVKARIEKAKAEIVSQQARIKKNQDTMKGAEPDFVKAKKQNIANAKNIIKNLKSFLSDAPSLMKKAQEGDKKESFYSVDEKDEKKSKLQAEYRKHMDARSDAYQKFVDEKESKHDGSSDKFYNEDPIGYRRMRDEIDKHAAAADKVWDKLQKMK